MRKRTYHYRCPTCGCEKSIVDDPDRNGNLTPIAPPRRVPCGVRGCTDYAVPVVTQPTPYDVGKVGDFLGVKVIYDKNCPIDRTYLLDTHTLVMSHTAFRKRHRVWYKPWTWLRRNTYEAPWVVQTKALSREAIIAKYGPKDVSVGEIRGSHATFTILDECADASDVFDR